jgi:PAS domain S-box-containing protein
VPLPVWAVLWAATAGAVAVGAWSVRDWWAYGSAIAMVTVWSLQSLAAWWPLHVARLGWVSAIIYAGFAGLLLIVAGWREQVRAETGAARGTPDAVVVADQYGRITAWAGAAEDVFGWAATEILGASITWIMPERYVQAHRDAIARLRVTGRTGIGGRTIYGYGLHRDGTEVPIALYVRVEDTGDGPIMSAVIRRAPAYGLPWIAPPAPEPGS